MEGATRVFDLLHLAGQKFKAGDAMFFAKKNGKIISIGQQEYERTSYTLAFALIKSGIKPGDKIATIINNRPEWNYFDMAISLAGAVQVPVYSTLSTEHIQYIFNDAAISALIINDAHTWRRIETAAKETPSLSLVVSVDPIPGIVSTENLIQEFVTGFPFEEVAELSQHINPDELFSIIYTSGTTGRPKGVMLSHRNIVSNFSALTQILKQQPAYRAASVLPLCHIYERILNYTYQNSGTAIWYIDGFDNLAAGLAEAKPEIFCAVPRLLEKLFDNIIARGRNLQGFQKQVFFWAIAIGQRYEPGKTRFIVARFLLFIARLLVFSKWQKALGGKLVTIVSGGASLNPRIARIFWAAGFKIMEGYGLTETSPVVAVSNFRKGGVRVGTVGPLLPGVEVTFAPDGEILVRGEGVMMGYYNRPERTRQVIDAGGWFHTGDIGHMVDGVYLQITDRKKEIFKTSGGKYIAPQVLENRFKESAFIEQILVLGENRRHPAAIVVPSFEYLRNWCRVKGIAYSTDQEMANHPRIQHRLEEEITEINQHFGHHEQIKQWRITCDNWTYDSGELSPTLKLRRRFLNQKYASLIEEMYHSA